MNYVEIVIAALNREVSLYEDLTPLYALLVLTKGTSTTLEDVHDAWSIWCNYENSDHRSLIPFDELTLKVQELDRKYMNAIHTVALSLAVKKD